LGLPDLELEPQARLFIGQMWAAPFLGAVFAGVCCRSRRARWPGVAAGAVAVAEPMP